MIEQTENLAIAFGHLIQARMLIEIELENDPGSFALADALNLTDDACSQVRGTMASRLPERPILDRRAG